MRKTIIAAVLALTAVPALAIAHGAGQLKLATTSLTPGMVLRFTGAKFPKKEPMNMVLAGPGGRVMLGRVTSDSAGAFQDSVTIPAAVTAGSYRIVLIATDDDEVGEASVTVGQGGTETSAEHDHAAMMAEMEHGDASAEPLALARARSPLVTGGAFVAIALALAIGAAAVLRPRSA